MTSKFLLDTNILSEPLQLVPNPRVLLFLEKHQYEVATASIVIHELVFGYQRLPASKKRERIARYVKNILNGGLKIFDYNKEAAVWHGQARAYLMAQRKTPSWADSQIAAIAIVNGLTLVTRNTKDFQYFEDLELVNWFG
ncbi:type II toxin-antitoxin system VapC family toxin [Synechococcus sp. BDU 130192]|uniref:type II toxin-antitoxin system VapC family toxin n=1 Tax=Synechococcus sp. BDU 130192 TaxID=2042059 RepID=UPI000C072A51|nr:type II toxin-antitoxin system VapC family toxin [Synechococcus sp. BDU 130192]